MNDLEILKDALNDGNVEFAKDVVEELLHLDELNSTSTPVVDSVTGSEGGDVVVGILVFLGIAGLVVFGIRSMIKENQRMEELREKAKKKKEEEEAKISGAASRGATLLPKPDGGYYIIENEHSLALLKKFADKEEALHEAVKRSFTGNGNADISEEETQLLDET